MSATVAGISDQQALVLIPGLMCTADLFAGQLAALGDQADIQIADHGGSGDMKAVAASILAMAPATFALAGLSMGGYVAFEMMRQAPERISKLALLDTNARDDRPQQAEMRQMGIDMAREQGVRAAQKHMIPSLIHPDKMTDAVLVERIMAMADGTGVAAFERQQRAIMGRPDNRPFLAQINCPTLIIVGEQDALTPVKVALEMQDGIADSRLEVIAHCGHLSAMEQPDAVSQLLGDWLSW